MFFARVWGFRLAGWDDDVVVVDGDGPTAATIKVNRSLVLDHSWILGGSRFTAATVAGLFVGGSRPT
jgi:hypothetical protein